MSFDSIIKSIEIAVARDEVSELLKGLKKKDLFVISKYFNVYIKSTDKIDMIIRKIVENTVGSKLRTEAIKNINLHH